MKKEEPKQNRMAPPIGDGQAVAIGSLAGAVAGILLGLLIAWSTSPGWSLTSAIIIVHVTVAMIAMGAWCAPAIVSDPAHEEGVVRYGRNADAPPMVVERDLNGDRAGSPADASLMSI